MSEERAEYAPETDRERRAFTVVLDPATMPQRVYDAVLDLGDIMDDFYEMGKTADQDSPKFLRQYRHFLMQHTVTLTRAVETFVLAGYLYTEIDMIEMRKNEA